MGGGPRLKNARLWDREPDNWYREPAWVTRALCEAEAFTGRTVDPCAGAGSTIDGAAAAGVQVEGMDLRDRGHPGVRGGVDFFAPFPTHGVWPADNILSNPPYGRHPDGGRRLEERFLQLALERARSKVALFLLAGWINGAERGRWLETTPLYRIYLIGPRPSCPPGHLIAAGEKAGNGTGDYAWLVWLKGYQGAPTVHWLRRDG